MFVDTHCHLNMMIDKKRDELMTEAEVDAVSHIVESAHQQGVGMIVNVGTTLNETHNSIMLSQRYDSVFATAGIHPCDVDQDEEAQLEQLAQLVTNERSNIVAIGETGLDYYHKPFDAKKQAALFHGHIALAIEHDLPLVVHIRNAGDDALALLEQYRGKVRGVIHCFSLDIHAAHRVATWGGWYIGIDGPVTYPKNDWLREVVKSVSLEHILLETDAPFLPPQFRRGKQNSPVYLPVIAEQIAQSRSCSVGDVAAITTANAKQLFGI